MVNFNLSEVTFSSFTSENDVDNLLELIVISTKGETKLTRSRLKDDLIEYTPESSLKVISDDPSLEIDSKLFKSNRTPAYSFIAKYNSKIIAYALCHYHYSPWPSHCCFIDDIFVLPEYRQKGIGRKLFELIMEKSKNEALSNVYFENINENAKVLKHLSKRELFVSRDDNKDWSVLRIDY